MVLPVGVGPVAAPVIAPALDAALATLTALAAAILAALPAAAPAPVVRVDGRGMNPIALTLAAGSFLVTAVSTTIDLLTSKYLWVPVALAATGYNALNSNTTGAYNRTMEGVTQTSQSGFTTASDIIGSITKPAAEAGVSTVHNTINAVVVSGKKHITEGCNDLLQFTRGKPPEEAKDIVEYVVRIFNEILNEAIKNGEKTWEQVKSYPQSIELPETKIIATVITASIIGIAAYQQRHLLIRMKNKAIESFQNYMNSPPVQNSLQNVEPESLI